LLHFRISTVLRERTRVPHENPDLGGLHEIGECPKVMQDVRWRLRLDIVAANDGDERLRADGAINTVKHAAVGRQPKVVTVACRVESLEEALEKGGHAENIDGRRVDDDIGRGHLLVDHRDVVMDHALQIVLRRLAGLARMASIYSEVGQVSDLEGRAFAASSLRQPRQQNLGVPRSAPMTRVQGEDLLRVLDTRSLFGVLYDSPATFGSGISGHREGCLDANQRPLMMDGSLRTDCAMHR
jgi:hypothetical protein